VHSAPAIKVDALPSLYTVFFFFFFFSLTYEAAMSFPPKSLQPRLENIAKLLTDSSTTVSIAESTSGV
jgi:hypothetical protein